MADPPRHGDREWILARRAMFMSTALSTLACSGPSSPSTPGAGTGDVAGADAGDVGTSAQDDGEGTVEARLARLETEVLPSCSILDSVCAPRWRALAARVRHVRHDILREAPPGSLDTSPDAGAPPDAPSGRFLRLLERIEEHLERDPVDGEAAVIGWRNMVSPTPAPPPIPEPCLEIGLLRE